MAVNELTYQPLSQGILSGATGVMYTVPASQVSIKTVISLACINSSSSDYDIWMVPSGATRGDKHLIRAEKNAGAVGLSPGQTEEIETLIHLAASGTIVGQSTSAPAIAFTVSPVTMETT